MRTLITILLLSSALISRAATYTVCSSGCDYTSVATLFSAVDLAGGDIVEFRATTPGGSATFTEHIEPGANDFGSSGNPLIIRARAGDTITIDGEQTRTYGFKGDTSSDYITLDGIKFQGSTWHQIYVPGSTGDHAIGFTIQNCTVITEAGATFGMQNTRNGMVFNYTEDLIIGTNVVTVEAADFQNAPDGDVQTDGIVFANTYGTTYVQNNTVTVQNLVTGGHNDCLQFAASVEPAAGTHYIRNNRLIHDTPDDGYVQVMFHEYATSGTLWCYNNVFIVKSPSIGYSVTITPKATSTLVVHFYNNSFYTEGAGSSLWFDQYVTNPYVKNNAMYVSNTTSSAGIRFQGATTTPSRVNRNIWYHVTSSANQFYAAGDDQADWTEWQLDGYDANGFNTTPGFTTPLSFDLTIGSSSTAKDSGEDLSAYFTTDILGATRSGTWDIGAYEYGAGGGSSFTPFSIGGRVTIQGNGVTIR